MSNEKINNQIALFQDQIDNLEQSGHFTEQEMDSKTFVFRSEIESLQSQLLPVETVLGVNLSELNELVNLLKDCVPSKAIYVLNPKIHIDGSPKHPHYFSKINSPALINTWNVLGMNQVNRG
jgi:hypothetical protein